MKTRIVLLYALFSLLCVSAYGQTRQNSVRLWNSTIDNTPIGNTSPSTVKATTVNASGAISTTGSGVSAPNGIVSGFDGLFGTAAVTANGAWSPISGVTQALNFDWDASGSQGESDFINQRGGLSGGFIWYNTNGSTVGTQLMNLNAAGNLQVATVTANLTGNVTGNVSGSSGSSTGNSATATAFAATPSGCGTGYQHVYTLAANGNAGCATPVYARSTSVSSTAAGAGSTANTTISLQWNFNGTPGSVSVPDTNYAVSCSPISAFGAPYVQSISKTTTSVTVTLSNGQGSQAVASGAAEIDCTVTGS